MSSRHTINIDGLSEDELRDLNRRIVERVKMLQSLRAHLAMMSFSVGDRVTFEAHGRSVFGVVVRCNRKTITVIGDDGTRWGVSPWALNPAAVSQAGDPPVIVIDAVPAGSSHTHGPARIEHATGHDE